MAPIILRPKLQHTKSIHPSRSKQNTQWGWCRTGAMYRMPMGGVKDLDSCKPSRESVWTGYSNLVMRKGWNEQTGPGMVTKLFGWLRCGRLGTWNTEHGSSDNKDRWLVHSRMKTQGPPFKTSDGTSEWTALCLVQIRLQKMNQIITVQ